MDGIKLPKVTGWIFTGILIRATQDFHSAYTGLSTHLPNPDLPGETINTVAAFAPYMSFVLGYIAFTVGAALHFASLRNAGKRLSLLLLGEALVTPTVVVVAMLLIGSWIDPEQMNIRAAMILAAVAIAGAPGTTVLVVQEARSRGILTRTLVAAVALIDMVAVGAFAFVTSYLATGGEGGAWHTTWSNAFLNVAREFSLTFMLGR